MDTSLDFNAAEYKILIVDDVVSNVLLLKVLLKNLNYQIATANDGLQALSAVETEKPDLILLDVMMPGLNGFEVAEKLKENPETRDIPIIFLTALNATSDVVRGFETFPQRGTADPGIPSDLADRRQADHHPANRRAAAHDIGTG